MSSGAGSGRSDIPRAGAPLTDAEIVELTELLAEPGHRGANDLLAFTGVRSIAGLMTRVVLAEPAERALLLAAIRKTLAVSRSES